MQEAIRAAGSEGDSVGGVLETIVTGLPAGIGEPWFDSVESELAHLMFAVPACKGLEFGAGFAFASMRGSEANDPFAMRNGQVATATNKNVSITFLCFIRLFSFLLQHICTKIHCILSYPNQTFIFSSDIYLVKTL